MKRQTEPVPTQLLHFFPTLERAVQVCADTRMLSARAANGPRIGLRPAKGLCRAGS
ncbi:MULTISPECIES: hypothetical protein [unclassified Streptomyces]|uniref:hypothetical protein n=1 Tax=unclassified Streptomyces TaxID=2593676 RepID=UPI002E8098B8|nr:hypothetical protein [Streptomyces sp. NBC_00562]WUC17779.1 hypothetical protein OHA33_02185 [Streptomyces sp. NBC_00562]